VKLTVKRAELITELEKKRDEASKLQREALEKDEAKLAAASKETFLQTLVGWYRSVADGLEKGDLKVDEYGDISRASKKHDHPPQRPTRGYDVRHWERQVAHSKAELTRAQAPYEAALKLLGMATGDTVEIDGSDYDGLLSGRISARRDTPVYVTGPEPTCRRCIMPGCPGYPYCADISGKSRR